MRRLNNIIACIIAVIAMVSCSEEASRLDQAVQKKYWTPEDYENVLHDIQFGEQGLNNGKKLPMFSDPDRKMIIMKMTDPENYLVVMNDDALGVSYKGEVSQQFFDIVREMGDLYDARDEEDKLVYEAEFLAIEDFSLGLQIPYFKNGNEEVLKNADNPDSRSTQSVIANNEQAIIGNFGNFLDLIKWEETLSTEGVATISDIIDKRFGQLYEAFPDADYSRMISKMENLMEKVKSDQLKESMRSFIEKVSESAVEEDASPDSTSAM